MVKSYRIQYLKCNHYLLEMLILRSLGKITKKRFSKSPYRLLPNALLFDIAPLRENKIFFLFKVQPISTAKEKKKVSRNGAT